MDTEPAQRTTDRVAAMFQTLLDWTAPQQLVAAARAAGTCVGVDVVGVFVVDMEQETLQPLPGSLTAGCYDIDTTLPGRAYRTMDWAEGGDGNVQRHVFVPLLDGAERLGVIEAYVAGDGPSRQHAQLLAGTLAKLLTAVASSGDVVQRTRRTRQMRLASEIQWELLPPLTIATCDLEISGILEPCYEIGGDAFDYAINDAVTHLMLVDAMGHGLDSSLISTLVMGAYRHCRRAGESLTEMYSAIDRLMAQRFGPERFATAQLIEMDRRTGALQWVNAGHPPAMLVRDGKVVGRLEHAPTLPLGFGEPGEVQVGEISLQPGDAVLWFTDGVVDGRSAAGEPFQERRLADLLARALVSGAPVPEVVRQLKLAIMKHQGDKLRDDATMLFLRWNGRA